VSFRTLRVPLVLLVVAVVLAVGAAAALVAYAPIRTVYAGHLDRLLQVMAAGALEAVEAGDAAGALDARLARIVESPWKGTGVRFRIWSESAATIASNVEEGELVPPPDARPGPGEERHFDLSIGRRKARTYRCIWARRGAIDLVLAHPSAFESRRLAEAATRIGLLTAGIAALAIGAGFLGTRSVLRPLRDAAEAVRRARTDPSADLRGAHVPLELRPLVDAAREMHADLRGSIERRDRFVADVSHELRTPLSIAQSTLQLATTSPRSPEEYVRAIEASVEELRNMERLIEALALLSKLGPGGLPGAPIRLDGVLRRVVERHEGPDSSIACPPLPEVVVAGREELLDRLFSNLVENAIAHGPPGEAVRVELAIGPATCSVIVEDRGGRIPQEDLERMFDRFYRGRDAAERSGSGLGLAIARAIARHHGGDVTVEVVPGRSTRFVVALPRRVA
jgi:signal transduction histidine kinase